MFDTFLFHRCIYLTCAPVLGPFAVEICFIRILYNATQNSASIENLICFYLCYESQSAIQNGSTKAFNIVCLRMFLKLNSSQRALTFHVFICSQMHLDKLYLYIFERHLSFAHFSQWTHTIVFSFVTVVIALCIGDVTSNFKVFLFKAFPEQEVSEVE